MKVLVWEFLIDNTETKVILYSKTVDRLKVGQNSMDIGWTSYFVLILIKVMKLLGRLQHKFPIVDKNHRYIILDDDIKPFIEKEIRGTVIELTDDITDSIGLLLKNGILFCGDAVSNGFPSKNRT